MTIRLISIAFFFLFSITSFSQNNTEPFSILFYNVENLFDTLDDPDTEDDEYTSNGGRYWTSQKLDQKTKNISKVILSSSGWELPAIIALCEIENRYVLELLTTRTPLQSQQYKIIHKESPDHRGMDVALLYNPKYFNPISYKYYPLTDKNNSIIASREILYVSGIANETDTLHFFVNHWPSRYSGFLETQRDRINAANILRMKIDTLFGSSNNLKIVILGDFNDRPNDESIAQILNAKEFQESINNTELYNLSYNWNADGKGTLKYQSEWSVFDQFIVSGRLLNKGDGYFTSSKKASIVKPSFLLEPDEKYGGKKPKRTYYGFKYIGGFSDHLPILLRLEKED